MKERPILFSGEMVRAILDGRKTQTRRVVKPHAGPVPAMTRTERFGRCPYGVPGDRLWMRETWYCDVPLDDICAGEHLYYRASGECCEQIPECQCATVGMRWRPSIHMPRWASRITLDVTGVRVERVQEIDHFDAMAEGIPFGGTGAPDLGYVPTVNAFAALWDTINAKRGYPWSANPWVWVVEFKVVPS